MSMTRWLSGPENLQDIRRSSSDAPINNDQFTDINLQLPLLGRRQKTTSAGATVYILVLALYAAVVLFGQWLFSPNFQYYPEILCSCNVLLLALTGLLQNHSSQQVKKERRQGFLRFSERMVLLIHVPFNLVSYALGVPVALLIRMTILVEILLTGAITGVYLWRVRQHSLLHMQPDAVHSLYSAVQPPTSLGDLRNLDGGRLAEQQSLLLRYQQDNLRYLSEEILRLQESLNKYQRSEDGTPQVDVVHILEARKQELRAVTAERDQLQSELRLSRALIAERDSNVVQIQTINDRYVEENERLRAMLGEWSSRTARLELALEAERMSNAELHKRVSILQHSTVESTGD